MKVALQSPLQTGKKPHHDLQKNLTNLLEFSPATGEGEAVFIGH